MAAVKSAHPVDVSHNASSPFQSSASLQRSTSTSSSATAHPLDTTSGVSREEKASSSASSSPTFQSNSSSSNHKTISTTVSSTNTTGSLSPLLANSSQAQKARLTRETNTSFPETTNNDYSWDSSNDDPLNTSNTSRTQQSRSSSGQRLMSGHSDDKWNYSRYREEDDPYSPIADEQTPMEYPPVSDEDKEARAVEQNLERWASEERQRRKALRTSRTGSMIVATAAPGKLTKRLSALNILGTGRGPLEGQGEEGTRNGNLIQREASRESWDEDSKNGSMQSFRDGSEEVEDVPRLSNKGLEEARRSAKGKAREEVNPFRDPSTGNSSSTNTSPRKQTFKPTAKTPIVTPGKAPTIRHRAIEHARKTGGSGRMPSIVATDADEETEAVRHLQDLVIDPFQSASEMDEQRRYAMAREAAAKRTIVDGDEGAIPPVMAPLRKSMSDSKFNEIGLDDESSSTVGGEWAEERRAQVTPPRQQEKRKPWWTEWLCGCGNVEEEEGEQSGRTCPEW